MEIYVLDQNLDRLGAVDIYESFLWNPTYNAVGSWELRCPMEYFNLLQADQIIQCTEDDDHNGIIEDIEKVIDDEGVENLLVKGRMIEALLERRVAVGDNLYESQQPAAILTDMADRNIIDPADTARQIVNFEVTGMPEADAGVVSYSANNPTIIAAAQSLMQESHLGFALAADDEGKKYVLKLYKGENRTEEGNTVTTITEEPVENLLANGDFSDGFSGWQTQYNYRAFNYRTQEEFGPYPMTVSEGIVSKSKVCSIGDDGSLYDIWEPSPYAHQSVSLNSSHIYYLSAKISNQTDSVIGFGLQKDGACVMNSGRTSGYINLAALFVPAASGLHSFYMGLGDLANYHDQYVYMDYGALVDLTATFGAGNEPGLSFCKDNLYLSEGDWKYKKQTISFVPNGNDPLVFSRDRDTLIEIEYSKNIVNERNVLYIHGDGIDTAIENGPPDGWGRKEAYLDLSGMKRTVDGVTIPEVSYIAMLQREGRAVLRKMAVSEMIDGKYYLLSNKKYRSDFNLGDLVNCVDRIGIEVTLRITGTTEVWDTSGYSLAVSLGDDIQDIYETVKLLTKGAK